MLWLKKWQGRKARQSQPQNQPPAQPAVPLQIRAAVLSNVGAVRTLNEDVILYAGPQSEEGAVKRGTLVLVADGMGGHAAGEVASALASEVVRRVFYTTAGPVHSALTAALAAANRAILDWAKTHPECDGMGTTCTALAIEDGNAWLAHIGDSRAYLLRKSQIKQLSTDQTLVEQMVRDGKLTREEAANSPVSNVILQALGVNPDIAPVVWNKPLALEAGDILLVCSDGLSGLVPDAKIAELADKLNPHEACEALIEAAIAAGGHDNVSVGVLRAEPAAPVSADAAQTTRQMEVPENSSVGGETRQMSVPKH